MRILILTCIIAVVSCGHPCKSSGKPKAKYPPLPYPYGYPLPYVPYPPYVPRPALPFPPGKSEPLCGVYNGAFKTFNNIGEFLEYYRRGYGFKFFCNGPCPQSHASCATASIEPICASNGKEIKSFANNCALRAASRKGKKWRVVASGLCPSTSTTASVSAPATTVSSLYCPVTTAAPFSSSAYTDNPASDPISTESPVSGATVTGAPITDATVTDPTSNDALITDDPITNVPSTDAPTTDIPDPTSNDDLSSLTDATVTDVPITDVTTPAPVNTQTPVSTASPVPTTPPDFTAAPTITADAAITTIAVETTVESSTPAVSDLNQSDNGQLLSSGVLSDAVSLSPASGIPSRASKSYSESLQLFLNTIRQLPSIGLPPTGTFSFRHNQNNYYADAVVERDYNYQPTYGSASRSYIPPFLPAVPSFPTGSSSQSIQTTVAPVNADPAAAVLNNIQAIKRQ